MNGADLARRYRAVRAETERLASPLSAEDQLLQAMPDASPTKWHRAHTTWFFETFVLSAAGVPAHDARYGYLWNSYYEAIGPRHARPKRGLLSRPTLAEVADYRRAVDERVISLLSSCDEAVFEALAPVVLLGLAHEEQHQELVLTDILAAFAESPLEPAYAPIPAGNAPADLSSPPPLRFVPFDGGLVEQGHAGEGRGEGQAGFAFDNEGPRHRVFVEPFSLAERPILVADVLDFARDGGYRTPSLWLSDGWAWVKAQGVEAPGYGRVEEGALRVFTLHGPRIASPSEPASHLSYYEADAIARFLGGRLPTESEWELAALASPAGGQLREGQLREGQFREGQFREGQFRESGVLFPRVITGEAGSLSAMMGGVWEWTQSAYGAYPGYSPGAGALGEYNGKFMIGQQVLRGGSCLTNQGHMRPTYRNFWPPHTRFQMTGARVARDRNRNARAS